jgi:Ca-activated chloride channel family protein
MDLSAAMHAFHFLRPAWLLALPPLWGLAVWLARRRARDGNWAGLIDPELLPGLRLSGGEAVASASPWPWLALAWTLAPLALAGPSWQKDVTPGYRGTAAWVLVLDLSPSMSATDLQPNRVTRARYAIDDLLGAARDARVGLVAFSDEAYTVTPLTDDVATVRALLPPLAPDIMPSPGDRLGPALQQAGKLLQQAGGKDQWVIVLTDGFADPAAAFTAAAQLRSAGVTLDVVGIGTTGGAPLSGAGGFSQDAQGHTLMTRLDPDRLRQLAAAGGGDYADLDGLPGLIGTLQARRETPGGAVAGPDIQVEHWREAGIWLLPGILLLSAALSRRGWL